MLDELNDLAIFVAVADAHSFTRASAKLGKSQSALSQSLRRLEERLKLRLLTRTTRSVMPTPAGEQLLSTLRPALGEIEAQLNAISELRELPSGSLRLTAGRPACRRDGVVARPASAECALSRHQGRGVDRTRSHRHRHRTVRRRRPAGGADRPGYDRPAH